MCKKVGGKSISHFISARLTEVPKKYFVNEAELPTKFTRDEDTELMKEFNDGNSKRRWTYISRKLGKHYTPGIVKYRLLLLNSINNIHKIPGIEGQGQEIISFEDFIKIYYKSKHIEPYLINSEAGETDDSEENENEEDSSLISDDISLITDD